MAPTSRNTTTLTANPEAPKAEINSPASSPSTTTGLPVARVDPVRRALTNYEEGVRRLRIRRIMGVSAVLGGSAGFIAPLWVAPDMLLLCIPLGLISVFTGFAGLHMVDTSGRNHLPPQPMDVFDPVSLPSRDRLLAALYRMSEAVAEGGPGSDASLMEHGRIAAPIIEEIHGSPLSEIEDRVELTWVGSPARMSKGMLMLLNELISALEGDSDDPPTRDLVRLMIVRLIWPWRTILSDRGLHLEAISARTEMPALRRRPAISLSNDPILEMRRRLVDASPLDRVIHLRDRFETAAPEHLDHIDATQTRLLIDAHLPDLARRFVTAHDASTGDARSDAQSMAMSSLGLVEAALGATMERHALNARRALEDQQRFLETRIRDPWNEFRDDDGGEK